MMYAELVNEYCNRYGVDVLAYCLMSNHVHFIVIPAAAGSLAETFRIVHTRHARWLKKKRNVKGHLWQGRFFSSVLDEAHLLAAVRYVETNPVRASRAASAWQYRWSSAQVHTEVGDSAIRLARQELLAGISDWKRFLMEPAPSHDQAIRSSTAQGVPLGSAAFVERLERQLGRSLTTRPSGRPERAT